MWTRIPVPLVPPTKLRNLRSITPNVRHIDAERGRQIVLVLLLLPDDRP